jgi:hypothetical protein
MLLVGALVIAGVGYVVLGGPGSGLVESLGGNNPATRPTPAQPNQNTGHHQGAGHQAHGHHGVPKVAGHSAGRVRQVVVQKAGRCRPGSVCPVQVSVGLAPAASAQAISWRVGTARVCRHKIVWSPGTTVTARPGWTRVFAHSSVRVPQGRSLALVALTTAPARAQSRPVLIAGNLHC